MEPDHRVGVKESRDVEARPLLAPTSQAARATSETTVNESRAASKTPEPGSAQCMAKHTWVPFAIRWHFIAIPATISVICGVTIVVLNRYSSANNGLSTAGSAMFGWKFVPTLIAVLYTQLVVMILGAMKRTEPFARLARQTAYIPTGRHTVLEKSRPWWTTLVHGLQKKRNGGSRSWSMVLSSAAFILAVLGISPLSATLLYTKEVQWRTPAELTRFSQSSPYVAQPRVDRETFLRSNAAILQNYSSSPWATDEYFITPFYPKDLARSLWNFKSSEPQMWEAETTVFRNDYTCNRLRLKGKVFPLMDSPYGTYSASVIMESDDGCQYNITRNVASDPVLSAERNTQIGSWNRIPYVNDRHLPDEGVRINPISSCGQDEAIIMSTAWYGNDEPREFLDDFNITTYTCHNNHTMALIPVRASSAATGLSVDFDTDVFNQLRQPVPTSIMNISRLQDLYTDPDWYNYVPQKGYLDLSLGLFGGASALLGAKHRFNISKVINDPDLAINAAQMRRRVFAEILQTSLRHSDDLNLEAVSGVRTAPELRVFVSSQISSVLCALLFASFCILLTLMWSTRPSRRPLNLLSDPSTVLGLSALISSSTSTLPLLKRLDLADRRRLKLELSERRFITSSGKLKEIIKDEKSHTEGRILVLDISAPSQGATVPVLRIRNLVGLAVYILVILVAIATLFALSQTSSLHQTLFTYRANLELLGGVKAFSPLAFTSTLLAVGVTLWWESIDNACRTLQPFIAMASEPKLLSKGMGLSYQSTFWLWTSGKAARNKHWLLMLVAIGTFMTQAFTIAMSALFEQDTGVVVHHIDLNQTLELRRDPFVREVATRTDYTKDAPYRPSNELAGPWEGFETWVAPTLEEVFNELETNWMFTAMIQSTMDAPDPTWSKDGWSFVPMDLAGLQADLRSTGPLAAHNITVRTPAIRARIDCDAFKEASNSSLWTRKFNESGVDSYYGKGPDGTMYIPEVLVKYGDRYSRIITQAVQPSCCANSTEPGATDEHNMSVLAYWTENWNKSTTTGEYTTTGDFMIKWLRGPAGFDSLFNRYVNHLYFSEPPGIQAAICVPTIETSPAQAVVDQRTGSIRDFEILEQPVSADVAWSDAFQFRARTETPARQNSTEEQLYHHNVTTSYGVLFIKTLLRAASLQYLGLELPAAIRPQPQETYEKFFNMKDNTTGFNTDFMSYASYALAGSDPNALLEIETLIKNSQKVFTTFFQHYVSSSISLDTGGWAYQPIGSNLKVKEPVVYIPQLLPNGNVAPKFEDVSLQNTSRTVSASLSTRVPVLRINTVAFWVAATIMAWLLATLLMFAALQRWYLSGMKRNIECMADILVLVAGSERLMQLIEQKGVNALMAEDRIHTRLGWYRDDDGTMRWRIDVVDREQVQPRSLSESTSYLPLPNLAGQGVEHTTHTSIPLENLGTIGQSRHS
ncbi:hypothetical protein SVAN01_05150 [Stagonosporopsis vannaccii]|nr:hypothetical protein SVAN01_05150 [Stagonosporopsis vannaccii]